MSKKQYDRIKLIVKDLDKLQNNTVVIIGIGGVGTYTIEALARMGIKKLIIVDYDIIDITNLNRQLVTTHNNIGKLKCIEVKNRILSINPDCDVVAIEKFVNEDNIQEILNYHPGFIIDACDSIDAKVLIIKKALENNIAFISSMGAANKTDISKIKISRLDKTYNDRLSKVMRNKIKKEKINGRIPVVFSEEIAQELTEYNNDSILG